MDSADSRLQRDTGHLAKLGIDVDRLESEMNAAVARDARYWLENDTKIRAVEQRVPTYEHFRQLVAGCHLRPLDRAEFTVLRKTPSDWNPIGTSTQFSTSCTPSTGISSDQETMTPQKFYSKWQAICRQNDVPDNERQQRLIALLFSQKPVIFRDLFDTGLGVSILPTMLSTLDHAFHPADTGLPHPTDHGSSAAAIASILKHSSESNQFSFAVDLLSEQEAQSARNLFERIQCHEFIPPTLFK